MVSTKRSIVLVAFLVVLLGGVTGCFGLPQSDSEDPSEQRRTQKQGEQARQKTPDEYFPITLGSSWEYQGEGNEYAAFSRRIIYAQPPRAQIREENGGTVLASVVEVSEEAVSQVVAVGEAYDDPNLMDHETGETTVWLKAPLQVGTKWSSADATREITSVSAQITTPAGVFSDCVEVTVTHPNSTIVEYYKDGVGLVRREFGSGQLRVISFLSAYDIH